MCLFKQDEIITRLDKAAASITGEAAPVRILFSPTSLNHYSVDRFSDIYSRINRSDFDTVVIVESQPGTHEKKLPMPSHNSFTTRFGEVSVNAKLRNELCDEDDDFFIDDEAFSKDLSLFDQLLFLQNRLDHFSVLSLQITDETPAIVKELSAALEEILASRNALLVFCCDIHHLENSTLNRIESYYKEGNRTELVRIFNTDDVTMSGGGAFLAGLLLAGSWNTSLQFNRGDSKTDPVSGFASMQYHSIAG